MANKEDCLSFGIEPRRSPASLPTTTNQGIFVLYPIVGSLVSTFSFHLAIGMAAAIHRHRRTQAAEEVST